MFYLIGIIIFSRTGAEGNTGVANIITTVIQTKINNLN